MTSWSNFILPAKTRIYSRHSSTRSIGGKAAKTFNTAELPIGEFPYSLLRGVEAVKTAEDAKRGVNCGGLASLAIKETYGFDIPEHLRFTELYLDQDYFEPVEFDESQSGDLVWFGRNNSNITPEEFQPVYDDQGFLVNWPKFPVTHVGVNAGQTEGEMQVYHSTPVEKGNVIWPLSRFSEYSRYKKLYKISRLKDDYRNAS
jgi:hypothetical protein